MKTGEQLLQDWRRTVGAPLTIDEMLDPSVENVNEETVYKNDNAIVAEIKRRQAIRSGEVVEVESGDEDISDDKPKLSTAEVEHETRYVMMVTVGTFLIWYIEYITDNRP